MWLNKCNTQFAIGLIVFSLAMTTNSLPFHWNDYLELMRQLQFVATLGLAFGIFKAHPKHKDKFLLLWLLITVYCCLAMLNAGLMYWCRHLKYGNGSFIWVLLPWTFAAGVGYLWNIMYNEYVKLTIEAVEQVDETDKQAVASEEQPTAKYPNTNNLTILVHGQRMK